MPLHKSTSKQSFFRPPWFTSFLAQQQGSISLRSCSGNIAQSLPASPQHAAPLQQDKCAKNAQKCGVCNTLLWGTHSARGRGGGIRIPRLILPTHSILQTPVFLVIFCSTVYLLTVHVREQRMCICLSICGQCKLFKTEHRKLILPG